MNLLKRTALVNCFFLAVANIFAQGPNESGTYYANADGKKGEELKTAMAAIINTHTVLTYAELWEAFKTTDVRSDGCVWDMYSGISNFTFGDDQDTGKSASEGEVYNREHSFPKSWFGGNVEPMYTDLVHLVPTDKVVNNKRANYPFGETESPTYTSSGGFSKLGPSSLSDYTGTVFEPNDEYKGDFARIYFYMVTCYEDVVADWASNSESVMLSGNKYPALASWALNMLLRWSAEDPVSEKEINRNAAVYSLQGNRNPYVDYPGLEEYVWGDLTSVAFDYDNYSPSASIEYNTVDISESDLIDVYTITGVKVRSDVDKANATKGLKKGIYIVNNKKCLVK